MGTPYDEQEIIAFIDDAVKVYQEAKTGTNAYALVWVARVQFDAFDMGYSASRAKHLIELRQALGLGPTPDVTPKAPLTEDTAKAIVLRTGETHKELLQAFETQAEADSAATTLLLIVISALQQAGFEVARQRNPSGRVSTDKLAIYIGEWRCYDITSVVAGVYTPIHFNFTPGANPV